METPSTDVDDAYTPTRALSCCHAQRTKFPKDPRCRFTNIQKQLQAPFVVYADFESILQRVDEDEAMDITKGGDEPTPGAGLFQEHLPCSFAHKLVSSVVPDFSSPLVSYRGEDAGEWCLCAICKRKRSRCFRSALLLPNNCQRSPRQNFAPSTLPPTVTYATSPWEGTKCMIIVTLWGNIGVLRIVDVI